MTAGASPSLDDVDNIDIAAEKKRVDEFERNNMLMRVFDASVRLRTFERLLLTVPEGTPSFDAARIARDVAQSDWCTVMDAILSPSPDRVHSGVLPSDVDWFYCVMDNSSGRATKHFKHPKGDRFFAIRRERHGAHNTDPRFFVTAHTIEGVRAQLPSGLSRRAPHLRASRYCIEVWV